MNLPIRVLQVFAVLDRGGAETMLMNIYRNIDRQKVQFDFLVNASDRVYAYENEIQKLGGRIYKTPRFNLFNYFIYKQFWYELLQKHPEWKVIHGHYTTPGLIYTKIAKEFGVKTIVHSHGEGRICRPDHVLKYFLRIPLRKKADALFACSANYNAPMK